MARKIEIFGYFVLLVYIVWQFIFKDVFMNEFYLERTYIIPKLDLMIIYLRDLIIRGGDENNYLYQYFSVGKESYISRQLLCCDIITAFLQILSTSCIAIGRFDDIVIKGKKDNKSDNSESKSDTISIEKESTK